MARNRNGITRGALPENPFTWWVNFNDTLDPSKMLKVSINRSEVESGITYRVSNLSDNVIDEDTLVVRNNGYIQIVPTVFGTQIPGTDFFIKIKVQGIGYKPSVISQNYTLAPKNANIDIEVPRKNSNNNDYNLILDPAATVNSGDIGPLFKLYPENNYFNYQYTLPEDKRDFNGLTFKIQENGINIQSIPIDEDDEPTHTVNVTVQVDRWGDEIEFSETPKQDYDSTIEEDWNATFNISVKAFATGGFNLISTPKICLNSIITPTDLILNPGITYEDQPSIFNNPQPADRGYTLWVSDPEATIEPPYNTNMFIQGGNNGIIKVITDTVSGEVKWEFNTEVHDQTYIAIQSVSEDPFTGEKEFHVMQVNYADLPNKLIFKSNNIETDEVTIYSSVYTWRGYTVSQYPEEAEPIKQFFYSIVEGGDAPISVDDNGVITLTDTQKPGKYTLHVDGYTEVAWNEIEATTDPIRKEELMEQYRASADLTIKVMRASL